VVIYLDSSVVLARLLSEDRAPEDALFGEDAVASRLLQYEVWNRVHARAAGVVTDREVEAILKQVDFIEMTPAILVRALAPFPVPVRTLDSLHLATMIHLQSQGEEVELASYDRRMLAAAAALGIPTYEL
jgi:hypothetical protein